MNEKILETVLSFMEKYRIEPYDEKTNRGVVRHVLTRYGHTPKEWMGLPEYYIRRLCREVPGMAFQSGIKWYINLGKMADYFNGGTTTS